MIQVREPYEQRLLVTVAIVKLMRGELFPVHGGLRLLQERAPYA
jgi:hypothetical protein